MTPYRRNFIVGLTVLVALVALGWLILQFGGTIATPFQEDKLTVYFVAESAPGISEGSAIELAGQSVGRVTAVEVVTAQEPGKPVVRITGQLRRGLNLPANMNAAIRISNLIGGGASLSLEFPQDPATEALEDGEVIQTTFGCNAMVPEPLVRLADELGGLVAELRRRGLVENVNAQVAELGRLIENLNQVAGDRQTQTDVKQAITNFRQTSERAAEISQELAAFVERLDEVRTDAQATMASIQGAATRTAQTAEEAQKTLTVAREEIATTGDLIAQRLAETSQVLNNIAQITQKVEQGQGTAGQLVNDPQLYRSLVQSTQLLATTIEDLQRLVRQWEEEGVTLRLN